MDALLFLCIVVVMVCMPLKGYYTYKYLVLEEFKTVSDSLPGFLFKPQHVVHQTHSFGILPLLTKASSTEGEKARITANVYLVISYASLAFVVGYTVLFADYPQTKG